MECVWVSFGVEKLWDVCIFVCDCMINALVCVSLCVCVSLFMCEIVCVLHPGQICDSVSVWVHRCVFPCVCAILFVFNVCVCVYVCCQWVSELCVHVSKTEPVALWSEVCAVTLPGTSSRPALVVLGLNRSGLTFMFGHRTSVIRVDTYNVIKRVPFEINSIYKWDKGWGCFIR